VEGDDEKIMRLIVLILISCWLSSCKNDRTPSGLKKYDEKSKTKEENLFINQASFYLNTEYNQSIIFGKKEGDSINTYYMDNGGKNGFIAFKVYYKYNHRSVLYKIKNGKHIGYAFYFDDKNRLREMKDYEDWKGRLLNQWISFDTTGKVLNDSYFMVYSPEFRTNTDSIIDVYSYPKKLYKLYGKNYMFSILSTKSDTLFLKKTYESNRIQIPIDNNLKKYDTLILYAGQRYQPPDYKKEGSFVITLIKKMLILKTRKSIPEIQFPKNMVLPQQ
jgi:hypothetical protein